MSALFTTSATATGGRKGRVVSDDKVLDLQLISPKELGGPGGEGTTPEQLFAAGYAACFDGALDVIILKEKAEVSSTSVKADVHFLKDESDDGYKIAVALNAHLEGVDEATAKDLVNKAHAFCPYSKATNGNIDVELNII
ncbi:organic hydroperoxide resistance protein [Planomicrobium sp. Y74]|uniref:organic hydroperoxide resistance protein n=1 Tax=Planomicrobium sp. Y74 TaxID=2478977 RepID=UPI000EF50513|nr:organic hydroperoxide resistance protein [Planomicrobium sp. Y74]RLQ92471.1 organic hydroperoxide resistance protein [Planomicrobium sp. Y74]